MSEQHKHQASCTAQQLDVQRSLHQLACHELVLVKEKRTHDQQYEHKDMQEVGSDEQQARPPTSTC